MTTHRKLARTALVAAFTLAAGHALAAKDTGSIRIDGSSTVFPITEAVAEEFRAVMPDVQVTVGISGTGGGFKKFTAGELDMTGASRPIKPKEADAALQGGVAYVELPVAYDGLSVVVNPKNTWVDHLTVAELKKIWEPSSKVSKWSDVRAGWPDSPIRLYGPGADSGTFDYFTEVVNGAARASRSDYTASEDDNVIVQGIAGDEGALGYFGYAYYIENKDRLKVVPVDGGKGPVTPSPDTIMTGSYAPLSRPIFVYVRKTSRPEVRKFVEFYLESAPQLVPEVGYIPLPTGIYEAALRRFRENELGSPMAKASAGAPLEQVYR